MAKKKSTVNKSKAIRDYLAAHPEVGPTEVAAKLGEQGVAVSPSFVSVVKGKMKSGGSGGKKRKKRVVKKPKQPATTAAAPSSSKGLDIGDLVATKKLVDQVGGAKQVRAALDALERLR